MENNKQYCPLCGKEKPQFYIEYINKYVYIKCECEKQKEAEENEIKRIKAIETYINQRTQSSHIQLKDVKADLSTLKVDNSNKFAIEAAQYMAHILLTDEYKTKAKNGLILKGNCGSGKTHIASAIINEYNKKHPLNESAIKQITKDINNGYINSLDVRIDSPCKIIKEDELLRLYGRYDYRTDTSALDEFRNAKKLLVIDDLGTATSDIKKIQAAYFNIIDYRYSNMLPIIITTNMNNTELKNYLGDRTYDRLNACCFSINLVSNESRRSN